MAELVAAQKHTEAAIQRLTGEFYDTKRTMADLGGDNMERRYREKAFAYFGSILRRMQVVPLFDIEAQLEQRLTDAEMGDLAPLDLLVRGQVKQHADKPEIWLAVEVSSKVDRNDIDRALRRAALLRKAGLRAIATVAGNEMTSDAQELVRRERVLVVQDGQKQFWDQALAEALAW